MPIVFASARNRKCARFCTRPLHNNAERKSQLKANHEREGTRNKNDRNEDDSPGNHPVIPP